MFSQEVIEDHDIKRLCDNIKEDIDYVRRLFAGDFNDKETRTKALNLATHKIHFYSMIEYPWRKVTEYVVKCNEKNNDPSVVDNHDLIIEIWFRVEDHENMLRIRSSFEDD